MTDDGEQLLRQIWEAPEDRTRLAVYADWLLEHGDASRGEYIQLALLAAPTPEQAERMDALHGKHRNRWLGDARSYVGDWRDSEVLPSFPAAVTCTIRQLAAGFDVIRDLAPRLVVAIEAPGLVGGELRDNDVKRLLWLPLGQLHGMAFAWLTDRVAGRLAPVLDGIQRLELDIAGGLRRYRLTPEGLARLVAEVSSLVELSLSGDVTDAFARALLDGPRTGELQLAIPEPTDGAVREQLVRAFAGRLRLTPRVTR